MAPALAQRRVEHAAEARLDDVVSRAVDAQRRGGGFRYPADRRRVAVMLGLLIRRAADEHLENPSHVGRIRARRLTPAVRPDRRARSSSRRRVSTKGPPDTRGASRAARLPTVRPARFGSRRRRTVRLPARSSTAPSVRRRSAPATSIPVRGGNRWPPPDNLARRSVSRTIPGSEACRSAMSRRRSA